MTTSSANTASTTILDLPTELIEYICCCDSLKFIDVLNLAVSHSKLKNCLFDEQNSRLWKSKYIRKYGLWDDEEYRVVIDEQNTWKDEIMLRMTLDKAVPAEIKQMPCKHMLVRDIPYHAYPFSKYLHSKNEGHRYYVLSTIAAYYKQLQRRECSDENYDLYYMAHQFLMYSCQVYFGYKLCDFLSLPPVEQTVERGFYLLERRFCPTAYKPYRDMNKSLNNIAIDVYNRILSANPVHPLFEHENCLKQVAERGKFNLDHDLFDETSTMFILDNIREIIFSEDQLVCHCNDDLNCFFLQQVIERRKGSVFLLCIIFESVARRLGVKVCITAQCVHSNEYDCVFWSSSWPGNKRINPTRYLVNIANRGIMEVSPVSRKLSEQFIGDSILDLFWTFSDTLQQVFRINSVMSCKYVWDFKTFLKPDDSYLETIYGRFLQVADNCRCPLLRNPANPNAPNHEFEENNIHIYWENKFPLTPRRRGDFNNPKFSIGMMIEVLDADSSVVKNRGIVVGWKIMLNYHTLPTPLYYVLIRPSLEGYDNPVIYCFWENCNERLQRQLKPDDGSYRFMNIGKFFTHYSHEFCAFMPINSLAQLYPDDLPYTTMFKNV